MHRALAAVVLAALVLAVGGCGNDDATASKAISDSIMKSRPGSADLLTMKRKDADCIGDGLVEKVGTEKLQKYGLLTKDNKAKDKAKEKAKEKAADRARDAREKARKAEEKKREAAKPAPPKPGG